MASKKTEEGRNTKALNVQLFVPGLLPIGRQLHRRSPDQIRDRCPDHCRHSLDRHRRHLLALQDHQQVGLRGDSVRRAGAGKEEEVLER